MANANNHFKSQALRVNVLYAKTTAAKCKNYSLCKCFVHNVCARDLFACFEEGSAVTCYDCTVVRPVINLMGDTDTNGSGTISSTSTTTTTTTTTTKKKQGKRNAPSLLSPKENGTKRRKEKKDPGRARYSQFLGLTQYLYRNVKTLFSLWNEYIVGINGNKPAKRFTQTER